mgnify:CR=1 FL=1
MLLVPGFTGSKEDFIALLPLLAAAGIDAVAYDMPGQYESRIDDAPESRFGVDRLAADATGVARAVWPRGPRPHLLGHSLGGLVAREAILRSPDEFASLILLSSGPGAVPEHQRPGLEVLLQVLPLTNLADVYEAKLALDRSKGIEEPPEPIAGFLRRRWLASNPQALRAKAALLLHSGDDTAVLGTTGVPVLVVLGADDDVWWPEIQRAMAAELGAQAVELPGVGHSPAADAPEATAAAVLGFVTPRAR